MIVSVVQVKGGVGKSVIASNLAAGLSQGSVAMLDSDVLQSSYAWSQTRKQTNAGPLANSPVPEIPCFPTLNATEFQQIGEEIEKQYTNIIIDAGGFDSDLGRMAMRAADVIILPTSPDSVDLRGVQYTLDAISETCTDVPLTVVIGNRFDRPRDIRRFYEKFAPTLRTAKVARTYLRSLREYPRAYNAGLSAREYDKHSTAALRFLKLYSELNDLRRKDRNNVI